MNKAFFGLLILSLSQSSLASSGSVDAAKRSSLELAKISDSKKDDTSNVGYHSNVDPIIAGKWDSLELMQEVFRQEDLILSELNENTRMNLAKFRANLLTTRAKAMVTALKKSEAEITDSSIKKIKANAARFPYWFRSAPQSFNKINN